MARSTTKRASGKKRNISYSRYGYFFIIPFFIVYLTFSMLPLFSTMAYSTTNIGSTVSKFYGFSDQEAFYDQYLDLSAVYTEDFVGDVGVTKPEYNSIKQYFVLQSTIYQNDPFNEEGMKAIAALGDITDSAKAAIQTYLDTGDSSFITEDVMKELNAYRKDFSAPDKIVMDKLLGVMAAIDAIKNASTSEEDATAGEDTTAQDIMDQIPNIVDELTVLQDTEATDDNKQAFMAVEFYATKLNGGEAPSNAFESLLLFYESFATDPVALHDYDLYTTSLGLRDFGAISINITDDLTTLLQKDWLTTMDSCTTLDSLGDYANAKRDLNDPNLLKDLILLDDAGIINGYELIEQDGVLIVDPSNGLISNLEYLITNNYVSDPVQIAAVAHIRKLSAYMDNASRGVLNNLEAVKTIGGIDAYLNFKGERKVNIDKYLDYKSDVGLKDKLSLARYNELDQIRKDQNVAKAKEEILVLEAKLPETQAAYDAALAASIEPKKIYDAAMHELQPSLDAAQQTFNDIMLELRPQIADAKDAYDAAVASGNAADRATTEEALAVLREQEAEADAALQVFKDQATEIKNTYDVYGIPLNSAKEDLAQNEVDIVKQQNIIKWPTGVLEKTITNEEFVFVGLDNFKSIFSDTTRFNKVFGSLSNTITIWTMNFTPQILMALLLASWMTDNRLRLKGTSAMKALIYMPSLMTAATVAIFFYRSFGYSTNPVSKSMAQLILRAFGNEEGYNFFIHPWATRGIVAFINFWMWYGNTMILLIAGISSVSVSLFESAQIDGATSGQVFRKITLPLIRPIMLFTLVSSMIGGLQMFDIPKLLNDGKPAAYFRGTQIKSTETILMYIQTQAFGTGATHKVGLAAAVSVLLFVFTSICSGVLFYVMRDKEAGRMKKIAKMGGAIK